MSKLMSCAYRMTKGVFMNNIYDYVAKRLGLENPADFENLQKARKDLIGELDAILQYDEHIHESNNKITIETWEDIRNEELVHVGELFGLILYLAPYQKALIDQGMKEFEERLNS